MFFLTFVDLDECQSPDACGANDVCNNTIGSYRCECANGFVADSGTQDPLNPVCIGKKMDNQKMAEKRGQFQSLHQDSCPHSNKYSTLPSYIFYLQNARSQKLMYANLKSKFISLGKSVLPPVTFLLHGIKLAHILHLRD